MHEVFTWFNANMDISALAKDFPVQPKRPRMASFADSPQDIADAIAYAVKTGHGFEIPCSHELSLWLGRSVRGRKWIGGQAAIIANHLSKWARSYIGSPYIGSDLAGLFKRKSRVFVDFNGTSPVSRASGISKKNYIFMFDEGDCFFGLAASESSRVIASTEPWKFRPVFEGFSKFDADASFFSGLHHFSGRDWKRLDSFVSSFDGWRHLELTTLPKSKAKAVRKRIGMFDSVGMDDEEMEALFSATTPEEQAEAMLSSDASEIYMHGDGYYMAMVRNEPGKIRRAMRIAGEEAVRYSGGRIGEIDRKGKDVVKRMGSVRRHGDRWIVTVPYPKAVRPRHMAGMGDVISSTIVMFGRVLK